jgi:ferric-dicitrate binding protein FerR (iron transport regulator)
MVKESHMNVSTSVNKFVVAVAGALVTVFGTYHNVHRPVEAVIVGVTAALVYLVPNAVAKPKA